MAVFAVIELSEWQNSGLLTFKIHAFYNCTIQTAEYTWWPPQKGEMMIEIILNMLENLKYTEARVLRIGDRKRGKGSQ